MTRLLAVLALVLGFIPTISALAGESTGNQTPAKPSIIINLPSRILTFYQDGKAVKEYPVAIGKPGDRTPLGTFEIRYKEKNPTWIKPVKEGEAQVVIPSGPDNPLGYRWMEFSGLYGIHGTNNPSSIGGFASAGCIRMRETDVEELYDLAPLQTPVTITYDRIDVRRNGDQAVVLRIYPDAYDMQPIHISDVKAELKAFGVEPLAYTAELIAQIERSDGTPFVIGRSVPIVVVGDRIVAGGIVQNGATYLPVVPMATERKLAVEWNPATGMMTSAYGSAPGYVKNDLLYIKAADIYAVYRLYARWGSPAYREKEDTMYLDTYPY